MPGSPWTRRGGLPARMARRVARWRFRLLHARRYRRVDLASADGLPLLVLPGVFHPEFFFVTAFMMRHLRRHPLPPGAAALDMGTGSGALALAMARRGAAVTAIDIDARAVRCARANALLHGLEHTVRVLQGDLFAPVPGERFDLIAFNPPFYARRPRDPADRAWAGGPDDETLRRFLARAPCHLRAGGEVLLAASTEAHFTARLPRLRGYRTRLVARRELVGECLYLFSLRPEQPCGCW